MAAPSVVDGVGTAGDDDGSAGGGVADAGVGQSFGDGVEAAGHNGRHAMPRDGTDVQITHAGDRHAVVQRPARPGDDDAAVTADVAESRLGAHGFKLSGSTSP